MFSSSESVRIEKVLNLFPNNSQIALARIANGEAKFFGVIKKNDEINLIDNQDTVFDIGSISKVLTSTLLAQSVIQGKLSLDDAITNYADFPLHKNVNITFKQLSNHTSGLPRLPPGILWQAYIKRSDNPYQNFDKHKLLDYLQNELKIKKQGKERYSNIGVGILAHMLSHIYQMDYETLLQSNICQPFNMQNTTTNRELATTKLISGLNKKGQEIPHWDLNAILGAGGIYSNLNDMVKFVQANFNCNDQAFKLQHTVTNQVNACFCSTLGWFGIKSKQHSGAVRLWHNGGTAGFSSEIFLDVEGKNGLILLSNISSFYMFKRMTLGNLAADLFANVTK